MRNSLCGRICNASPNISVSKMHIPSTFKPNKSEVLTESELEVSRLCKTDVKCDVSYDILSADEAMFDITDRTVHV